jgi:hypothetical protein
MADSDSITNGNIAWDKSIDILLAKWCDQAKCFEWMHGEAHSIYDVKARRIMIAVNVITALSGISNVVTGGITVNGFQMAWVFGGLSVLISLITMLQDKLAYAVSAQEHCQYSQQWGLIHRRIEEEITLPFGSRKDCATFMKQLRTDINQVSLAAAGKIPPVIRRACFDKYSKIPNFDIPDICGHLEHTEIYMAPTTGSLSNLCTPTSVAITIPSVKGSSDTAPLLGSINITQEP